MHVGSSTRDYKISQFYIRRFNMTYHHDIHRPVLVSPSLKHAWHAQHVRSLELVYVRPRPQRRLQLPTVL